MTEITRRSLLRTGAAASAATVVGLRPWDAAPAAASAPARLVLRRSAYAGLVGSDFAVRTGASTVTLRLLAVADVAGARHVRSLAGSEDAFVLSFSGPVATPLDSGIHDFAHAQLGAFELFVSPVDDVAGDRRYEAVVDRSVGAPATPPAPAPAQAPPAAVPDAPVPPAAATAAAASGPIRRARLLRRATLRRLGRGARAEIVLRSGTAARTVRVRLVHKGTTVARGTHAVTGDHALVRLAAAGHLPAGGYLLVVSAIDAAGVVRSQRSRVTLR